MAMSKYFILFIASLSLLLSSCSFPKTGKTINSSEKIQNQNKLSKKNTNYYQKCKADIIDKINESSNEPLTQEDKADLRMNMFCKFLNSKNPQNITIIIGEQPFEVPSILDLEGYSSLASTNKLNDNYSKNAQCTSYYEVTKIESDKKVQKVIKKKKYICYNKDDKYEDSLINQCYLKGKVIKKTGKERFIPEQYICPDLESFYKSGREILE
jgi:hypothetical protein